MSKRVFFSTYADDAAFVERLHLLFDQNWKSLDRHPDERSVDEYLKLFSSLVDAPLIDRVRSIWEKARETAPALRETAYVLIAHAVFGEALARWPETLLVNAQFQEAHAYALDSQMRLYELTEARACFFALLHVCLGDLCEVQQRPETRVVRELRVEARGEPLFIDVFTALYRNVRQVMETGAPRDRLRGGAKELLYAAEIFLGNIQTFS